MKPTPLLIALSLCAEASSCASPPDPSPRSDEQTLAAETPALPPEVLTTLTEAAVTHGAFARRILYTWSSVEGLERSLAARKLLLPTEADGHLGMELEALASGTSAASDLARLLSAHPSFAARRYAWTRPFATREPLGARAYGDRLIEVELKPNAVIGRFDAQDPVPFRFVDLDGHEVPLGHVLADPSTLAAIYHVGTSPESGARYREFVLCNESMIASWSVGTDAIGRVLDADARALDALAGQALVAESASLHWAQGGEGLGPLYAASLAFDTERHRPTRENLGRIAGLLRAVSPEQGPPRVVVPTVAFIGLDPTPPPIPPLPPGFGVVKKRIYVCD